MCGGASRNRSTSLPILGCDVPGKIKDIYIDNVTLTVGPNAVYPSGVYDRRPCDGEGFVKGPVYGIYAENIDALNVKDFRFVTSPDFKDGTVGGRYKFDSCRNVDCD